MTYEDALAQINGSQDKLKTATELFGLENANVALILAENSGKVDELDASIRNANGALDEMTKQRLNTIQGQLTLTESAWNSLVLSIDSGSGKISTVSKGVLGGFQTALKDLTSFFEGGFNNVQNVAGLFIDEGAIENLVRNTISAREEAEKLSESQKVIGNVAATTTGEVVTAAQTYKDYNTQLSETNSKIQELTEKYLDSGKTNEIVLSKIESEIRKRDDLNKKIEESISLQNQLSETSPRGVVAPQEIGGIAPPEAVLPETPSLDPGALDIGEFSANIGSIEGVGGFLADIGLGALQAQSAILQLNEALRENQQILNDPTATEAQRQAALANIESINQQG